jgi:hypothetical protein
MLLAGATVAGFLAGCANAGSDDTKSKVTSAPIKMRYYGGPKSPMWPEIPEPRESKRSALTQK